MKITNTGTADIDITEFIEKLTTLAPDCFLTTDPNTKKVKIGDVEITLS